MPKTFLEDFTKNTRSMSPTHTIHRLRRDVRKAKVLHESFSNGKMKKSNPLLFIIVGGLVGKKRQLSRAARTLICAGLVLGLLQLVALAIVWISSLFA